MAEKMTREQTILFYLGACATLTVALVMLQNMQNRQPQEESGPVQLTAEQEAALFRPVMTSTTSAPTASELKKLLAPVSGGKKLSAEEEAALFRPVGGGAQ